MHRSFPIVALAASGLFAFTTTATAETITVCAVDCDHTSINAAIDAASNGDIIQLAAETYTEGEVINLDGKGITLLGTTDKSGTPTSILDGVDEHQLLFCTTNETSSTVLRNLLITRGFSKGGGGGLYVENASPSLFNCHFILNNAFVGGGLAAKESNMSLDRCLFHHNEGFYEGGGAEFMNTSVTLHGCTFNENYASMLGGGVTCFGQGKTTNPKTNNFTDCIFVGNITGSADSAGSAGGSGMFTTNCFVGLADCRFTDNQTYGQGPALAHGAINDKNGGILIIHDCDFCANTTIPTGSDQIFGEYLELGDGNCIEASCDDCPIPVEGDLDGDGVVDAADFVHLRALIGVETLGCVAADINGDGEVNGADLAFVLGYWGLCSAP